VYWNEDEINFIDSLMMRKLTWKQIAERMTDKFNRPFSATACRVHIKRRKKRAVQKFEKVDYKENIEILADGTHKSDKLLRMSAEQSKDVDYLLSAHGYSKDSWEMVSAKNNIWNVYSKQDGIQTLYSSKITVKPKEQLFDISKIDEIFNNLNRTYKPRTKTYKPPKKPKMLELNISDLHLGKLCWSGDTNDTYDMSIAEERFFYIIDDVLEKTKHIPIEKSLFIWSNDFFHFDTITQTTTAGTHQDSDTRWAKMYNKGTEMLIKAIEQLTEIAPVETMYIGSNHDKMTAYYATKHIEAWYRQDKHVRVDSSPTSRKYYEYGNNLIEFTHGHNEGKRIGSTMEVEARQAWGRTSYHEVHAGHFHNDQVKTMDNGTVIRYSPSPTGTDVYHFEKGYVGAIKKGQSYLWDKETGLDLIIPTTIKV
jgi:hypothetical protein